MRLARKKRSKITSRRETFGPAPTKQGSPLDPLGFMVSNRRYSMTFPERVLRQAAKAKWNEIGGKQKSGECREMLGQNQPSISICLGGGGLSKIWIPLPSETYTCGG